VSALEAMQGVNTTFIMEELYILLCRFEEKLKQASDYQQNTRPIIFFAWDFITNTSPISSNSYLSNESFIQILDYECSNDVMLLPNLFYGIL
jgi:hemolysin-activating ACP:hemolysin acyltransferase